MFSFIKRFRSGRKSRATTRMTTNVKDSNGQVANYNEPSTMQSIDNDDSGLVDSSESNPDAESTPKIKGQEQQPSKSNDRDDAIDSDTEVDANTAIGAFNGRGVGHNARRSNPTKAGVTSNDPKALGYLNCRCDDDAYPMKRHPRGKCILLNIENFHPSLNLSPRPGSSVDGENFTKCFQALGFEIIVKSDENCTRKDIFTLFEAVQKLDHSEYDCFVVCIMTHGERGLLKAYDGDFSLENHIFPFIFSCPSLFGKPKLFFIQACRGQQLDSGVTVARDVTDSVQYYKIPMFADVMVAYSTVEGYYSWRHVVRGSWFIQSLVAVLRERAKTHDLMTMMTEVNQLVAYQFISNNPSNAGFHEKKQVPCVMSMLTRKLYFFDQPAPPKSELDHTYSTIIKLHN